VAQVGSKLRLKSESVMDSETGGGAYSSTSCCRNDDKSQ